MPASETEDSEMSEDEMVKAVYGFAIEKMNDGLSPTTIDRLLEEQGLPADVAQTVVSQVGKMRAQAKREAGQKNMLYGALWCIGGIVVTVASFGLASGGGGGGRYVVAWGAILFGGIQFFQGLSQSSE